MGDFSFADPTSKDFLGGGFGDGGLVGGIGRLAGFFLGPLAYILNPPDPDYSNRTLSTNGPTTPRRVIYGEARVGGQVAFMETSGSTNETLNVIYILASHPCESIEEIYIGDTLSTDAKFTGKITTISSIDGLGVVPAEILAVTGIDGTRHKYMGLSYLFCQFEFAKDTYQGIPNVSAVIKGKNNILDTRTNTRGYTANAALCELDWMLNYVGIDEANIRKISWDTAANDCATMVPGKDKDNNQITEPRFELNGTIILSGKHLESLSRMVQNGGVIPRRENGIWVADIQQYSAPVISLSEDDLLSHVELTTGAGKQDKVNTIKGSFIDADNQYEQIEYPVLESAGYVTNDKEVLERTIDYQLVSSASQCRRLSKIQLEKSRFGVSFSAIFRLKLWPYPVGTRISFSYARYGWVDKVFRIVERDPNVLKGIGLMLREDSPDIYSWNDGDAINVQVPRLLNLPEAGFIAAPTNLVFTPDNYNEFSSGVLTWDDINNPYLHEYVVTITNADTGQAIAASKLPGTSLEIQSLPSGNYTFSAYAVVDFSKGASTAITVQISNPAISSIGNFRLLEGGTEFLGKDCKFSWSAPNDAEIIVHDYVVEIQHPSTGAIYFSDTTRDTHYTFTHAQNKLAGLHRTFKIRVYARGKYGQDNVNTGAAELTVSNPLPSLLGGVAYNSTQGTITLKFNPITDTDFKAVKVWLSESTGFAAIDGQQAFTTQGNQIEFDGLTANTPYYLRYSVLDDYHADSDAGVLSGELEIYTAPDAFLEVSNSVARGNVLTEMALLKNTANTLAGIQDKKELIEERTKVIDLTALTDTQATKLVTLEVETDTNKNSIVALDVVTQTQATSLDQVNTEVADNKASATSALNAQTGYCTLADYTTQGTCETAGGTWKNEPLALSFLNAAINLGGSVVTAGSIFETLSNNGALNANASLFVDVDGTLAGVFIGASATSSSLILKSENLKIKTDSGTKTPFDVVGNTVQMVDVLIKSSINLNDQFTVDALGNVLINSGSFTGSLNAAGGRLRASKNTFITVVTPNRTDDAILVVDSSDLYGVAGIVGVSKDTYGGYFYSDSGDALRGISLSNDGVNGTSSENGKGGVRATNEFGPQVILSNNNAVGATDSGTYIAADTFPEVTLGGLMYTRKGVKNGWYFGFEVNGVKKWGRNSFYQTYLPGAAIP